LKSQFYSAGSKPIKVSQLTNQYC